MHKERPGAAFEEQRKYQQLCKMEEKIQREVMSEQSEALDVEGISVSFSPREETPVLEDQGRIQSKLRCLITQLKAVTHIGSHNAGIFDQTTRICL